MSKAVEYIGLIEIGGSAILTVHGDGFVAEVACNSVVKTPTRAEAKVIAELDAKAAAIKIAAAEKAVKDAKAEAAAAKTDGLKATSAAKVVAAEAELEKVKAAEEARKESLKAQAEAAKLAKEEAAAAKKEAEGPVGYIGPPVVEPKPKAEPISRPSN